MNNRKIKKNRGGKRLGWAAMARKGWLYQKMSTLTVELLEEYLMNLFINRHEKKT